MFTSSTALNHMGSIETKLGLKYNLIQRDPMRDVRVIEKCYNISPHAFNYQGKERALIKHMMKDTVPSKILENNKRGLQAADWLNKIVDDWAAIKSLIENDLKYLPDDLIDKDIFIKKLHEHETIDLKNQMKFTSEIRNLIIVHSVCKMFKENSNDLNG
jgi:asparagine synthase (glutamine-hydrolysing)